MTASNSGPGIDEPKVRPIRLADAAGYHACFDAVARERRWLARTEAPPREATDAFVASNIEHGRPHLVAVVTAEEGGDEVVAGWCDVVFSTKPSLAHAGELGMGLRAEWRGRGTGGRLLAAALEAARSSGLERVELEVVTDNVAAIRLYARHGFEAEGLKRRAMRLGGRRLDLLLMARLLD